MPGLYTRLRTALRPAPPELSPAERERLASESAMLARLAAAERRLAESLSLYDGHMGPFGRMGYGDPLEQDAGGWGDRGGYGGMAGRAGARKDGGDWLLLRNMTDLTNARGESRLVCEANSYASGFLDRAVDFVVGEGMAPQVTLRGPKAGAVATGVADADGDGQPDADPRVERVRAVIEDFRELNCWGVGEEDREEEGFRRSQRDGEVAVRFFRGGANTNGVPRVRWIEPEQIDAPPGSEPHERWGLRTDPDDVESVEAFWVRALDTNAGDGWIPASEIVFHKLGTDRTTLRGYPLFHMVASAFWQAEKINNNMADVVAIQAQIAYIRQHAAGTLPGQITTFVDGQADYQQPRITPRGGTDKTNPVRWGDSGQVVDMSAGMMFQAGPASTGIPGFVQGLQSRLREICAHFGYPEFFTADASNNNFASILVTGSPFERNVKRRQRRYAGFQQEVYKRAVAYAVAAGRLSEEDARACRIEVKSPGVALANKLEDAQVRQIEAQNKVLSPQTWMAASGYDPRVELANIQALADAEPSGGGGMDFGGDDLFGPPADAAPVAESLRESVIALLSEIGPPPFEGAVFDKSSHRWKKPGGTEAAKADAGPDTGEFPDRHKKGASKAGVEPLRTGATDRQADAAAAKSVLGTDDPAAISAVVGAPDDAVVKFRKAPGAGEKLQIEIHHDDLETPALRYAYKDADGKLVIENSDFRVKKDRQGRGLGAQIFARQVEAASAMGADRIECHAACENVRGDREYNGFYTWPRFGYDQSIDSLKVYSDGATDAVAELREKFPQAKTVLDVMSTKEGAAWWKEKGVDMAQAKFDLTPGSRSMGVLTAYLDAKAGPKKESRNPTRPPTTMPRSTPSGTASTPGTGDGGYDPTEYEIGLHRLLYEAGARTPPRPGLVWKDSTKRWVKADTGDAGKDKPKAAPKGDDKAQAKAHVAEMLADPSKVTAENLPGLRASLGKLTVPELKEVAKSLKEKVGGTKAALAERIVAAAKAKGGAVKPQGGESKPQSYADKLAALAAEHPEEHKAEMKSKGGTGPSDDTLQLRRQHGESLVAAWRTADKQGHAQARDYLETMLENTDGMERIGDGEGRDKFDGRIHHDVPGMLTGTPVRVVRPGWSLRVDDHRSHIIEKASVEPVVSAKADKSAPKAAPAETNPEPAKADAPKSSDGPKPMPRSPGVPDPTPGVAPDAAEYKKAWDKAGPQDPARAQQVKDGAQKAYHHLTQFAQFQHGRVEIRRIYHQMKKTDAGLSVEEFHRNLLELSKDRKVELHVLNEVKEAQDKELSIERDGRSLYYVIADDDWKTGQHAKSF